MFNYLEYQPQWIKSNSELADLLFADKNVLIPPYRPELNRLRAQLNEPGIYIAGSGSSGQKKLIQLKKEHIIQAAQSCIDYLDLQPGHRWLCCLPLYHIGGLSILFRCYLAKSDLVLQPFQSQSILNRLNRGDISHISLVPTMLNALLEHQTEVPSGLKCVLLGGAPASSELIQRAIQGGWPIQISYGMTESAAMACSAPADPKHPHLIGQPLPHIQIKRNDQGYIGLKGNIARWAYTEQGRIDLWDAEGWLWTQDKAKQDQQGRWHFQGRGDHLIYSGGLKLDPQWIAAQIRTCSGIDWLRIEAESDPYWGQKTVLYYRGRITPEALQRWIKQTLPAPLCPKKIKRCS